MNFGEAIRGLKAGEKVQRAGWNGKGMFLMLVKPPQSASPNEVKYEVNVNDRYENIEHKLLPWIGMKTADDCFVPWLASQTDILADDWQLANEEPVEKLKSV